MPRTVFPDAIAREDGPSLGFPADAVDRARIPDDRTVWAFSDIHGVRSGLEAALAQAGLIDSAGGWVAPPGTALVGLGDFIDRGLDSAGVMTLLMRLASESAAAGSQVVLTRGNHEQMLIDILRGDADWLAPWLSKGGHECLRSLGWEGEDPSADDVVRIFNGYHPDLASFIEDTLPYGVWRDVLLVHAAPPPGIGALSELVTHDAQMWHATEFVASDGIVLEPGYEAYRAAGIRRVAMGHVPQTDGPTVAHNDAVLLLDTNASAKGADKKRSAFATLVRLPPGPGFDDAEIITIDTSDAPDRAPRRKGS